MSSGERDKFSAAAPALGYFYQCRYALLAALRRLPDSDAFCIYIETLDDVVFESEGGPVELLQTKHKLNHETDLSDSSTDLWKSLRIWLEGTKNGSIPVDAQLFLLTTATCVAGAAVSYLRSDELRDITKVITRLDSIASTSTNKTNEDGYTLFRELESASKKQFLERVIVLDAAPTIADLDDLLRRAVYYAVERKFLNLFLEKMEGWWLRRLLKHLITTPATPILSGELESERNLLREQFKEDNLPIDDEIMGASVDATGYQSRIFVNQLRIIGVNDGRILHAIKNYFRAFEQRSRWVREDLLLVGELDRYERRLIEEWEIYFLQMKDALGDAAADEIKREKAAELYKWVESGMHAPIRPGVVEPAIARGTYQILSDAKRVGWHVEFVQRLESLLAAPGDAT